MIIWEESDFENDKSDFSFAKITFKDAINVYS